MKLYRLYTLLLIGLFITSFDAFARTEKEILVSPISFKDKNGVRTYSELVILNENWDTLHYRKFDGILASNFSRWQTPDGIRYTFYMQDSNSYHPAGVGYSSGYVCVADSNLEIIKKLDLLPYKKVKLDKVQRLDAHDFIYIADDHYIALAYHEEAPNNIPLALNPANGVRVLSSVIQEVKDGRVVWQWDATDYPELYAASHVNNNFNDSINTQDYLHINSLFIDPLDNNLIVSCKNTNQVLKIDRLSGDIIWRLGGRNSDFPLSKDQYFIHQHHVTITNDRKLLLFDNGDDTSRKQSRILEFALNEKRKTVERFRSLDIPGKFTPAVGSVQKFENTYFLSTGTALSLMSINFQTGEVIFEKKLPYVSYRALMYDKR